MLKLSLNIGIYSVCILLFDAIFVHEKFMIGSRVVFIKVLFFKAESVFCFTWPVE